MADNPVLHRVGRLGFGGAPIGNLYSAIPDGEALATVLAAWDAGIRYFDTAPHYGLGLSERRLGAVLRDKPREEFVISTKVGRLLEPQHAAGRRDAEGFDVPADAVRRWDFNEQGIRRSLEDSLLRLGLDRVDIAYLHDPDAHDLDAGIRQPFVLEKLQDEGLAGAIGVGTNSVDAALACVDAAELDLVMLAGRYTLLEQPRLPLLERCMERGTGVVAVGVFNSGLLARPEVPADAHYNYGQAPAAVLERARALAALCRDFGVELPTAALHFPLRHPAVVNVTVGVRSPEQVVANAARMDAAVPDELWDAVAALGPFEAGPFGSGASGADA
ncbi:aldo/keto reductase [Arthrobacter sp. SW1]|uniref:aldo/keto reductase n=1 Tax=Arthrobacter sp. SW1 TaxID=1920889 RepID=UPI000877CD46|nr:aldo/keto reductase [Arthrobacter sp. SW1]OFI38873.1 aldo/keto reductase [Arthrobacter sp. SW1]